MKTLVICFTAVADMEEAYDEFNQLHLHHLNVQDLAQRQVLKPARVPNLRYFWRSTDIPSIVACSGLGVAAGICQGVGLTGTFRGHVTAGTIVAGVLAGVLFGMLIAVLLGLAFHLLQMSEKPMIPGVSLVIEAQDWQVPYVMMLAQQHVMNVKIYDGFNLLCPRFP